MKQLILLMMSFALAACTNSTPLVVEGPVDTLASNQARAARYETATLNQ